MRIGKLASGQRFPMGQKCGLCGSAKFRLSGFRRSDLSRLLRFKYPVRCRNCGERNFTSIWSAFWIGHADRARRRKRHETSSKAR